MSIYKFDHAISGFFYANSEPAKASLPQSLQLVEPHPGLGVVNVTMFNFFDSVVGPYIEMVISLSVTPWVPHGEALPLGAFYPLFLASTTDGSRIHAVEAWKLPDFGRAVDITLTDTGGRRKARVEDQGQLIVELEVAFNDSRHSPAHQTYQSVSSDDHAVYVSRIDFWAGKHECENETAHVSLGDHHSAESLKTLFEEFTSFREMTMTAGEERIGELVLQTPLRRMP